MNPLVFPVQMDLLDSAAVGKYLFQILGLAPHEVIHSKLRRAFGLIALAVEIRNLDYAYICIVV